MSKESKRKKQDKRFKKHYKKVIENADDTLRVITEREKIRLDFNQEYENPYQFEFNCRKDVLRLIVMLTKELSKDEVPF